MTAPLPSDPRGGASTQPMAARAPLLRKPASSFPWLRRDDLSPSPPRANQHPRLAGEAAPLPNDETECGREEEKEAGIIRILSQEAEGRAVGGRWAGIGREGREARPLRREARAAAANERRRGGAGAGPRPPGAEERCRSGRGRRFGGAGPCPGDSAAGPGGRRREGLGGVCVWGGQAHRWAARGLRRVRVGGGRQGRFARAGVGGSPGNGPGRGLHSAGDSPVSVSLSRRSAGGVRSRPFCLFPKPPQRPPRRLTSRPSVPALRERGGSAPVGLLLVGGDAASAVTSFCPRHGLQGRRRGE